MTGDAILQLALGMPHGWEWIIILAILLLLFGKRLPEVGRSLGRGITEFRKGVKSVYDEIDEEGKPGAKAPPPADARSLPQQPPGATPAAATPSESTTH
jgi:sec-independent protein translocase protein TatA